MSEEQEKEGVLRSGADMSSEEVEALLDHSSGKAGSAKPGEVRDYDLAGRERIIRGAMPSFDRINERWVAEFQQTLSERVRRQLEVTVENVQPMSYADWLAPFPSASSLNLLSVKPWGGTALVAIESRVLSGLVEAFYGGGSPKAEAPARATLGRAEERFNRLIVDALVERFQAAFTPIAQLEFEFVRTELNPHYASIATPSETVLVTKLELKLDELAGQLCLVMPSSLVEPVRERLDEQLRTASPESKAQWQASLREHLAVSGLEITGVFFEGQITMKELLRLKSGDVWPIEMPKTAVLRAGGVPLVQGKFGRSRGYNAIKVIDAVQQYGTDASRR
ncbi:MAG: hypothetical protein HKN84_14280 [Gammaproteobacteria bacterium]|nr:hypothetical protein [Gammaproteobacteria bacterium]